MGKDAPAGCKFDKGLTALRKTLTVAGKATPPRDQPKVRSMTQPHDPLMRFSGSGCLPWCSPVDMCNPSSVGPSSHEDLRMGLCRSLCASVRRVRADQQRHHLSWRGGWYAFPLVELVLSCVLIESCSFRSGRGLGFLTARTYRLHLVWGRLRTPLTDSGLV